MMKLSFAITFMAASATALFAGESSLTCTFQPLNGMATGEIVIAPVMCHDWYAFSGQPTAIGLITAKNIPPTNAPESNGDINFASASGLVLTFTEDPAGRGIVTLDCRKLRDPPHFGSTNLQVVGATLECLRQVAGTKLDTMTVTHLLTTDGQEAIRKLVDIFNNHPKNKPFQWK